jgi:hypothetical protein
MMVRYNAHAMGRFGIALFLLAAVFGGYSAYRHVASPLMSTQAVADDVGRVYHDAHPDVIRVISTETDGPVQEPMYGLTVRGHFHYGSRHAHYLSFSALATRRYAWALWAGDTLPDHAAHRSWFADVVPLARRQG